MRQRIFALSVAAIVVTVLLVAASAVYARGFRVSRSTCFSPAVVSVERVVHQDVIQPVAFPVPFTVAVPVVSYLHNGSTYSPAYAAQLANPAPAVVTQQQLQQPQQTAAPAASAAGLSDAQMTVLLGRIEEMMKTKYGLTPVTGSGNSLPPPVPTDGNLTDIVKSILSKNCASCHTGASAKGQVVIFSDKDVLNPNAPRQRIWDAADEGRMPPEAKKDVRHALSDADVAHLRAWMLSK